MFENLTTFRKVFKERAKKLMQTTHKTAYRGTFFTNRNRLKTRQEAFTSFLVADIELPYAFLLSLTQLNSNRCF